jgi:hypothetical protein
VCPLGGRAGLADRHAKAEEPDGQQPSAGADSGEGGGWFPKRERQDPANEKNEHAEDQHTDQDRLDCFHVLPPLAELVSSLTGAGQPISAGWAIGPPVRIARRRTPCQQHSICSGSCGDLLAAGLE